MVHRCFGPVCDPTMNFGVDYFLDAAFLGAALFFVAVFLEGALFLVGALFFAAVFLGVVLFLVVYFEETFLAGGTFLPSALASDNPIAIACFLLVTVLPLPPLFNVPCLRSCIAFSTLSRVPSEYFVAMIVIFFLVRKCSK